MVIITKSIGWNIESKGLSILAQLVWDAIENSRRLLMKMLNVLYACAPAGSVTLNLMVKVPRSEFEGMPFKVRLLRCIVRKLGQYEPLVIGCQCHQGLQMKNR